MFKNLLIAFLIGFVAAFGTIFYIGRAFHNSNHPNVDIIHPEFLPLIAGILLALANVFNVYTNNKYSFLIGLFVAYVFSTYGIFIGLPETIFKITHQKARLVAFVYYTLLFIILGFINKWFALV